MNDNQKKKVKDIQVSREIINEILKFGVTDDQKLRIIYLLCLELENNSALKSITSAVRNYMPELEDNTIVEKPGLQI